MKKYFDFKKILSIILICAMFLPVASAYYSRPAIMSNKNGSTVRAPMFKGTCIHKATAYISNYKDFLDCHPSQDSEEVCGGSRGRSTKNVYEEEVRHIGACAFAIAILMNSEKEKALKFSIGITRFCDELIGYPKNFNAKLLVYVANFAYAFLGDVFKSGDSCILSAEYLCKYLKQADRDGCVGCGIAWETGGMLVSDSVFIRCMKD